MTASSTVSRRVAADPELFELVAPAEANGPIRLFASYSPANGETYWPRRRRCPVTLQPVEDVVLDALGVLWSWTYLYVPWRGSGPSPSSGPGYGAGIVELPAGPRVLGLLVGDQGDWTIGDEVEGIAWDFAENDGITRCVPAFRPSGKAPDAKP